MWWRESARHKAHTTVENSENESVSMRMSPTNRMAVSAPYITHGYMGTPNNFACGGRGGGVAPCCVRTCCNSSENEVVTHLCTLIMAHLDTLIMAYQLSCIKALLWAMQCVFSLSCSLQGSGWYTSPTQAGMCQCSGRGVS